MEVAANFGRGKGERVQSLVMTMRFDSQYPGRLDSVSINGNKRSIFRMGNVKFSF